MAETKIVFELSRNEFLIKKAPTEVHNMITFLSEIEKKLNMDILSLIDVKILKTKFILTFSTNSFYVRKKEELV